MQLMHENKNTKTENTICAYIYMRRKIKKSVPHSTQPHQHPTTHSFYRPYALPAAQPTTSKHWCSEMYS